MINFKKDIDKKILRVKQLSLIYIHPSILNWASKGELRAPDAQEDGPSHFKIQTEESSLVYL